MAVNITDNLNRFNNVKDRARKLIQMDAQGELSKKAKQARNEGKLSVNVDPDGNFNGVDANINQPKNNHEINQNLVDGNFKAKNVLPREIMESFKHKQINVGSVANNGSSVLDDLEAITGKSIAPQQVKQQVVEQSQYVQPLQTVSTVNGVDYSMIKMIVEESMRKYTSALKKSLLNENKNIAENTNNIQAIKIGDKFSFITENGDLYEAKLEFKKNIKKKQQ